MRYVKQVLLTCFEVAAYGVLLLLLPCVVAHVLLDCMLTDILIQAVVVAVAGTGILTTIAIYEGWYLDHLSGWGFPSDRIDEAPPPSTPGSREDDGAR